MSLSYLLESARHLHIPSESLESESEDDCLSFIEQCLMRSLLLSPHEYAIPVATDGAAGSDSADGVNDGTGDSGQITCNYFQIR